MVGLTSNTLGRAALAGRDHNKHFHEAVINLVASTLDNEDILVSDGGLDAHRSLTIAELLQLNFGW